MADLFNDELTFLDDADVEVTEMSAEMGGVVTVSRSRVQELMDSYEDTDPVFTTLRVRPTKQGSTSGNGNHWPASVLTSICEQINRNEPPGYWGHIKPENKGYEFPDIETVWLGAKMVQEGGTPVLFAKGYTLPGTRARRHAKAKTLRMASWAGRAGGKIIGGVRMVESFALESIDWARPGSAGMDARVVAVTSEMTNEEGSEDVDWAKATLADIERENPSLLELMRQKVTAEHEGSVSEMKTKADQHDADKPVFEKLREVLGLDPEADLVKAVTEVVGKVENLSAKTIRDKVADILTGKLKDERAKATVLRLIPVTEMEGKTDDEITEMVDDLFESDEDIKAVVSEMGGGPAPLPRGGHTRDLSSGSNVGGSGMIKTGSRKL